MKKATEIFKALSDPTRLRIIMLLLEKELCVCELIYILKMEQSRISHQLRFLKYAGLVENRRDGRWIIYSISKDNKELLELILKEALAEELKSSPEIKLDLKNLRLCLKKDVRKVSGNLQL
ncbi:MAG: ArsR/SmtB family transcription factor [Candidatus Aminicenantales bacterium]